MMTPLNAESLRQFLEEEFTDMWNFIGRLKRGTADVSVFDPEVLYEDSNLPDHAGEVYQGIDGIIRAGDTKERPQSRGTGESLGRRAEAKVRGRDQARRRRLGRNDRLCRRIFRARGDDVAEE